MRLLAAAIIVSFAGCGGPSSASGTTGAGDVARTFFESVINEQDQAAYDLIDPESRHLTLEGFTVLSRSYTHNIGFHAERVHMRSCDEQGDTAIAHVMLNGRGGHARYSDGITLRRVEGRWFIVLPATSD